MKVMLVRLLLEALRRLEEKEEAERPGWVEKGLRAVRGWKVVLRKERHGAGEQ
ncbi:MAG: hypothetical protein KJZ84_05990 [Bryobacteraceae bacterium]|nr:hypothetical protein [Bryobacteraceae bacterium]